MTVTAAGERLSRTARTVLDELDRAESEIKKDGGPAAGLIRLSTQCHTAYHWFPRMLTLFQKKFPAVEVQLVIEATNHPFVALLEGKLDLAIVCDPIRNRKIRYTPLFEDDVVVVVPPKHRLATKQFVAPGDFVNENLLLYPPKENSTLLVQILEPSGVRPENSGGDADGSHPGNGDGRAGSRGAPAVGGGAAARFTLVGRVASATAGLPVGLVRGAAARKAGSRVRAGVHPPADEPTIA